MSLILDEIRSLAPDPVLVIRAYYYYYGRPVIVFYACWCSTHAGVLVQICSGILLDKRQIFSRLPSTRQIFSRIKISLSSFRLDIMTASKGALWHPRSQDRSTTRVAHSLKRQGPLFVSLLSSRLSTQVSSRLSSCLTSLGSSLLLSSLLSVRQAARLGPSTLELSAVSVLPSGLPHTSCWVDRDWGPHPVAQESWHLRDRDRSMRLE